MKRFLAGWGVVLLAYQLPLSAETLTVQVSGIKDPGEIHIAIYDSAEAFEGDKGEKGAPAEGIVDGVVEEAQPAGTRHAAAERSQPAALSRHARTPPPPPPQR